MVLDGSRAAGPRRARPTPRGCAHHGGLPQWPARGHRIGSGLSQQEGGDSAREERGATSFGPQPPHLDGSHGASAARDTACPPGASQPQRSAPGPGFLSHLQPASSRQKPKRLAATAAAVAGAICAARLSGSGVTLTIHAHSQTSSRHTAACRVRQRGGCEDHRKGAVPRCGISLVEHRVPDLSCRQAASGTGDRARGCARPKQEAGAAERTPASRASSAPPRTCPG